MDPEGWLSRRADPLYAQPRARRRPARGGSDPHRPAPAGGPLGSDERRFLRPTLPSRRVLQSKFPRRNTHEGATPLGADLADLDLADELSPLQPHAHPALFPDQRRVDTFVDRDAPSPGSPIPRPHIPGRSCRWSGSARAGRSRPATTGASIAQVLSDFAALQHEVPVDPVPSCSEQNEASRRWTSRCSFDPFGPSVEPTPDQGCQPRINDILRQSRSNWPLRQRRSPTWSVPGDSQRSLGADPATRGHDGRPAVHGLSRRLAAFLHPGRRPDRGDVRGRDRLRRLERHRAGGRSTRPTCWSSPSPRRR